MHADFLAAHSTNQPGCSTSSGHHDGIAYCCKCCLRGHVVGGFGWSKLLGWHTPCRLTHTQNVYRLDVANYLNYSDSVGNDSRPLNKPINGEIAHVILMILAFGVCHLQ